MGDNIKDSNIKVISDVQLLNIKEEISFCSIDLDITDSKLPKKK